MLRIPGALPDAVESLVHSTIGCSIVVHRALGPGLLEGIYSRAICIELQERGIPFEREKQIPVLYRGHFLCHHRLDIVVAGEVVLEVKAVDKVHPVYHAQVLSYLRISEIRVGLLINFNVPVLQDGIKRIVL